MTDQKDTAVAEAPCEQELEAMATELVELVVELSRPIPRRGAIVDYHTHVKTYPAIVVAVGMVPDFLDLAIFGSPLGTYGTRLRVRHGGPGQNNTWSWAEAEQIVAEE